MSEDEIGKIKKVGNAIASILLGNTKDLIVRTDERVNQLKTDVKEIKTDCKQFGKDIILLKREAFGNPGSPLVLKEEHKAILESSNIKEQIDRKEGAIIQLIQSKNPITLLDAQDTIDENIETIISWFDLADLKNKMYYAGLTAGAEEVLIALYLYERIIPKLTF